MADQRARPVVRRHDVVLGPVGHLDPAVIVNEQTFRVGSEVVIDLEPKPRLLFGWLILAGRWCPKTEWNAFIASTKKQQLEQEPILSELVEEMAGSV